MGTISLIVDYQQELDFFPLFFGYCEREVGYGPTDRMAVVLWVVSGAFFSGAVDLFKSIDDCIKGCYMWTA
jgi:hypothetical protein